MAHRSRCRWRSAPLGAAAGIDVSCATVEVPGTRGLAATVSTAMRLDGHRAARGARVARALARAGASGGGGGDALGTRAVGVRSRPGGGRNEPALRAFAVVPLMTVHRRQRGRAAWRRRAAGLVRRRWWTRPGARQRISARASSPTTPSQARGHGADAAKMPKAMAGIRFASWMRNTYQLGVVTNDIFTREDMEFLVRSEALPSDRTHRRPDRRVSLPTAIREDASLNSRRASTNLSRRYPPPPP